MRTPNGFGSVYKLSGQRRKPFIAVKTTGWTDTGKQKREVLGYFRKKEEGLAALSQFHINPYSLEHSKMTFAEMYGLWSKEKYPTISDKGIKGYVAAYKHVEQIHAMRFTDLKAGHLQDALNQCPRGYATRRKIKNLYSQIYRYALKRELCSKDYSRLVDTNAKPDTSKHQPFRENEIQTLWDNIDRMDFIDTVLVLIYTGFRISELLLVENRNIDFEEKTITGGIKTEAGKDRLVPIHPRILPIIEKYYNPENEYLIANHIGKRMSYDNYRRERWNKIMEQLDMSHLPHDTRHTFVTRADNYGANEKAVKRIVGHAGKDITDKVYTHKDITELRKVMDLIP